MVMVFSPFCDFGMDLLDQALLVCSVCYCQFWLLSAVVSFCFDIVDRLIREGRKVFQAKIYAEVCLAL